MSDTVTYQQEAYLQLRNAIQILGNKKRLLRRVDVNNIRGYIKLAMEELREHLGSKAGLSSSIGNTMNSPTTENILKAIRCLEHPTIFVPRGDLEEFRELSIKPEIKESKYLKDGVAYIVAGIGIVAGHKAYHYLLGKRFNLEWEEKLVEDLSDPFGLEVKTSS